MSIEYYNIFIVFTWITMATKDEVSTSRYEASPFIDVEHPITLYEGVKLVIMAPIALMRLLLILMVLFLAYLPSAIVVSIVDSRGHLQRGEPLGTRTQMVLGAIIRGAARVYLFIAGFYWIKKVDHRKIDCPGKGKEPKHIMVYNHVSYCDPLVLLSCVGPCSGVAKSGVATIPLVGKITVALQYILISRNGSNDKANKFTCTLDPQEAVTKRSLEAEDFPVFTLAPEATTKPKHCLLKFRKGAFVPGKPVVPVLLKYPCKHFNVGWGIPYSDAFHVWRFLSQCIHRCEIEILSTYYPSSEEQSDPELYAENVRKLMGDWLGVDLVDSDVKEECHLRKLGVSTNFRGTRVVIGKH